MPDLKTLLSGRINGKTAKTLANTRSEEELFALLFNNDKRISDNAAWVMTHLPKTADAFLNGRRDTLINEAMHTTSPSKRRLIMNLLERTSFTHKQIRSDFLDFCLNTIVSNEPIGIRSLAIKLAYTQCIHYPELHTEFDNTLKMMDTTALPPALKHIRGKMLGRRLR